MKTLVVSLFALLILVAVEAQATQEVVLKPPRELPTDVVADIVSGKIGGIVVREIVGGHLFAYDVRILNTKIRSKNVFVNKFIQYRNGKWLVSTFPEVIITEGAGQGIDPIGTFFCFFKC